MYSDLFFLELNRDFCRNKPCSFFVQHFVLFFSYATTLDGCLLRNIYANKFNINSLLCLLGMITRSVPMTFVFHWTHTLSTHSHTHEVRCSRCLYSHPLCKQQQKQQPQNPFASELLLSFKYSPRSPDSSRPTQKFSASMCRHSTRTHTHAHGSKLGLSAHGRRAETGERTRNVLGLEHRTTPHSNSNWKFMCAVPRQR